MRIVASQFAVGCALWLLICPAASAKRKPPEPVKPVVSGGVRYSVGGNGRAQSIVARAVGSGAVLWSVEVFRTKILARREKDSQEVFITEITLAGQALLIRDEKDRCYSLDLATKLVKRQSCAE